MKILSLSLLVAIGAANLQNNFDLVVIKCSDLKEAVKVYATPNNKGSITISSANHNRLSFYLFDLEGNLVYQTPLKKDDTFTVDGLQQGTYTYNAFKNDENIEGGNIILK